MILCVTIQVHGPGILIELGLEKALTDSFSNVDTMVDTYIKNKEAEFGVESDDFVTKYFSQKISMDRYTIFKHYTRHILETCDDFLEAVKAIELGIQEKVEKLDQEILALPPIM